MAPKRSRSNGHPSEPYHFFKVVLEDSLRNGKLEIPPKFGRDYGNALSNPVFIKVPHAPWRKLELKKYDGKFWLEKGWKKFSEDYSLERGHFLLFRYEGNSHFHVLIFDMTATEIAYPSIIDDDELQLPEPKIEEFEEDVDVRIINDIPTANTRQWSRPHKMMKTTDYTARIMTNDEKSKALERVVFESENPYFKVVMQSTYVNYGPNLGCCQLSVPKSFSRRYLKNHGDVILCDSAGNTWPAAYYTTPSRGGYVKLHNGWSSFVRDNNLKVGNVCAFELVNSIDTTFKVSIYRDQYGHYHRKQASTDVSYPVEKVAVTPSPQRKALRAREAALQRARAFTSPFFLKQLGPSYVRTHDLSIPNQFSRENMDRTLSNVEVVLLSNGKSWPAVYRKSNTGSPRSIICHGWRAFVRDNCLEVGDVCVFEMKNDTKISFEVFIYQAISDANSQPSQGALQKTFPVPSQLENKLIQASKLDIACAVVNPEEEVFRQKNPEEVSGYAVRVTD